jgi:hypothetical protein
LTTTVCFEEESTGTKITDLKTVLGSGLGEDVFSNSIFFCDIQRYHLEDQGVDGIKMDLREIGWGVCGVD